MNGAFFDIRQRQGDLPDHVKVCLLAIRYARRCQSDDRRWQPRQPAAVRRSAWLGGAVIVWEYFVSKQTSEGRHQRPDLKLPSSWRDDLRALSTLPGGLRRTTPQISRARHPCSSTRFRSARPIDCGCAGHLLCDGSLREPSNRARATVADGSELLKGFVGHGLALRELTGESNSAQRPEPESRDGGMTRASRRSSGKGSNGLPSSC